MGDVKVLRVFNNNVVLARADDGGEVIVTGRGVGFQARPGHAVDPGAVQRTFVPADGRDSDNLASMLAAIPAEYVTLAAAALEAAGGDYASSAVTVVALADHLGFAVHRAREGLTAEFPLRAEVEHLYPDELATARRVIAYAGERVDVDLDPDEAVAVALHLVNAAFSRGDLSWTYQMTGVLSQVFEVLAAGYGRQFDQHSINSARFITHLRYLFVRARKGVQLADGMGALTGSIRQAYPEAWQVAMRIAGVLELRLGTSLTSDEVTYLALHTARLASE